MRNRPPGPRDRRPLGTDAGDLGAVPDGPGTAPGHLTTNPQILKANPENVGAVHGQRRIRKRARRTSELVTGTSELAPKTQGPGPPRDRPRGPRSWPPRTWEPGLYTSKRARVLLLKIKNCGSTFGPRFWTPHGTVSGSRFPFLNKRGPQHGAVGPRSGDQKWTHVLTTSRKQNAQQNRTKTYPERTPQQEPGPRTQDQNGKEPEPARGPK